MFLPHFQIAMERGQVLSNRFDQRCVDKRIHLMRKKSCLKTRAIVSSSSFKNMPLDFPINQFADRVFISSKTAVHYLKSLSSDLPVWTPQIKLKFSMSKLKP